jgi:tellurite methyltransferase
METPRHQGWEELWRRGVVYGGGPQPEVVDLARRLKAAGRSRALDLGCGIGRHLLWLTSEGFSACGCDISPTAVAACRRAATESGLEPGIVRSEMTSLPFKDAAFDAVIAWDVIFHSTVAGILATVREVRRSLCSGGLFLVTFNSIESTDREVAREAVADGTGKELEPETYTIPDDVLDKSLPHHYTTEPEIRERLLAGFRILEMKKYVWDSSNVPGSRRHVKWWVLAEKD